MGINIRDANHSTFNYKEKFKKVKSILDNWSFRGISLIGKVTVIKSLALSQLIHLFSVLLIDDNMIKELKEIFFDFIWGSKSHKIATDTLCNSYSYGGLKMINVELFIKSIRFAWVHKMFDNHNFSPWKLMLQSTINKFGGNCIFYLGKTSLSRIAKRIKNPFWSQILLNWAELELNSDFENLTHILSQPLWHNDLLKAGNKTLNRPKLKEAGILMISDIIDHQFGIPMTEIELNDFDDSINFLNYQSIIRSIPEGWKLKILFSAPINLNQYRMTTIQKFRRSEKPSRFIYELIMEKNVNVCNSQNKWEEKDWFEKNRNWTDIFEMPFLTTKETKIISFQYNLVHRAIFTNTKLVKAKLITGPVRCSFCNIDDETIEHLFYFCPVTRSLYLQIMEHLKKKGLWPNNLNMNPCDILFGFKLSDTTRIVINYIFLYAKYFIHVAKCKNENVLSITSFLNYIRHKIKLEKISLSDQNFVEKWGGYENI